MGDNMVRNQKVNVETIIETFSPTVYLDVGRQASDSATLAFTFSGTLSRFWDIKVTQIPCNVNYE